MHGFEYSLAAQTSLFKQCIMSYKILQHFVGRVTQTSTLVNIGSGNEPVLTQISVDALTKPQWVKKGAFGFGW